MYLNCLFCCSMVRSKDDTWGVVLCVMSSEKRTCFSPWKLRSSLVSVSVHLGPGPSRSTDKVIMDLATWSDGMFVWKCDAAVRLLLSSMVPTLRQDSNSVSYQKEVDAIIGSWCLTTMPSRIPCEAHLDRRRSV